MRFFQKSLTAALASALLSVATVSQAERSYQGPESIPEFHPLCLEQLRNQKANGGALDMFACSELQTTPIKRMPDGGFLAKRPNNLYGQSQGFIIYKPLGTLDNSMELLLVHDKTSKPIADSSIYVIGRLPDHPEGYRDYLTRIEEKGDRCNGGIQSAVLINESLLEVNLTVNPDALMRITDPAAQANSADGVEVRDLNDKAKGRLDDRSTTCIGRVTKTYNLIDNKQGFARIEFFNDSTRVALDPYQQCFDKLVKDFVKPPQTISMQDFALFKELFKSECDR